MKRDFTHENFEDFLKRSADSLRMKAPDKVWQNLSKELGRRRRRFITGVAAFLLVTTAAGYLITTNVSEQATIVSTTPSQHNQSATVLNGTRQATSKNVNATITQPASGNKDNSLIQQASTRRNNNEEASFNLPESRQEIGSSINPQTVLSEELFTAENNFTPTVVDSYTEFDAPQQDKKNPVQANNPVNALPMTIESVVNSFKAKNKKGKIETQYYFTPTISYRKLSENKSYLRSLDRSSMPTNFPALTSSVNNNVTHKPDVGFELGLAVKLPVSKKLKIRSGLQFNVNRYDIRAFNSTTTVAPIALNNGQTTNVVNTITNYSNEGGYKRNWLQNLSFQASAPVGVEYSFGGNEKLQFGIGTTVQPTYVIGDRAYLITMDYKSYTQEPWLIRRWNVNTSLETFVTYDAGKTKWQVGPQVRYQLLSSFISKYPVKENLFDFGLKVGVSFNK